MCRKKKKFVNPDMIENLSDRCYYIYVSNVADAKIHHQERLFYKTPNGGVDINLDMTEDGKILGIEILDNDD